MLSDEIRGIKDSGLYGSKSHLTIVFISIRAGFDFSELMHIEIF